MPSVNLSGLASAEEIVMLRNPFKVLAALLMGTGASYASPPPPDASTLQQKIEAAKPTAQKLIDDEATTTSVAPKDKVSQWGQQFGNWGNWSNGGSAGRQA